MIKAKLDSHSVKRLAWLVNGRVLLRNARVASPLYARRTRKRRDRDAVASPFPSKSGLRPKVLLSSRRRSPGCEGYTRSGCARPAPPTYRLESVGTLYLTVPTFTVATRTSGRTPDAYDKPPPMALSLSLS